MIFNKKQTGEIMKSLIFTTLFLLSFSSLGSVVVPRNCNPDDLNTLRSARNLEFPILSELIENNIIPEIEKCMVFSPVKMFPTVCGQLITNEHFFTISTKRGNEVKVTTKSSYRACYRFNRTFLQLEEVSIKPIKK